MKFRFVAAITLFGLVHCPVGFADSRDAWRAYLAKDYERAVALAQPSADSGNMHSQYLLGLASRNGRAMSKDPLAAARWFELAADQGHGDAANELASMLAAGEGIPRDDQKALALFERSAEAGSAAGQQNLAKAYVDGVLIRKSPIMARYWYEQADATLYARTAKRLAEALQGPPNGLSKLPELCAPRSPPTKQMMDRRLDELNGTLRVYVDEKGGVRGVRIKEISAPDLRFEAVAWFSESLRNDDCTFPKQSWGVEVWLPFKFVLY